MLRTTMSQCPTMLPNIGNCSSTATSITATCSYIAHPCPLRLGQSLEGDSFSIHRSLKGYLRRNTLFVKHEMNLFLRPHTMPNATQNSHTTAAHNTSQTNCSLIVHCALLTAPNVAPADRHSRQVTATNRPCFFQCCKIQENLLTVRNKQLLQWIQNASLE